MPQYSEEFKDQAVSKMMPPNAMSVAQVSRDIGVPEQTLYNWRNRYRQKGRCVPADPKNPEHWNGETKLSVVIETAAMNEQELSAYCRQKGLYVEQIQRWRAGAVSGASESQLLSKVERLEHQKDRKQVRKLERELKRKEKALAEAAALLVLQKKARAIWGESEED